MRRLIPRLAAMLAMAVALVVAVVFLTCAAPQVSAGEEDASVEVESDIVTVASAEEWDMEAAIERARTEEAELLRQRVEETSPDPHAELEARMAEAIVQEQPWYRKRRRMARRLARIIMEAAIEHDQVPWIALSMAYKESSLSPGVGRLKVTGDMGEEGYFQIMPRSFPLRACGKGRSMGNARANADTAMCYLALVRAKCETDDPWQYVLAYGMSRCPRPGEGRELRPSKRARAILCRMVGEEECEEIWPS